MKKQLISIGLTLLLLGCTSAPVIEDSDISSLSGASSSQPEEFAIPVQLRIPKIAVNAQVELVGLTDAGDMDAPKAWENVGWYKNGPRPGETGKSVIDGHLDSYTDTAVFWRLKELKANDVIEVVNEDGQTLLFTVLQTKKVGNNDIEAAKEVFEADKNDSKSYLNLITCTGTWDTTQREYGERLVVFTEFTGVKTP